jgi:type VI secretion system protein ImpM
MSRGATIASIGYFGKVPGRGDFVKGGDSPALIKVLDDWLAQAMDLMSADARWKLNYDAVAPLHFAFGPRRRHAIAGHIVASSDQSSRRFRS